MIERSDGTNRFTSITFEITNICNKNCGYCIKMPRKEDKIEHMKIEDYKHVVSCISKKDRENFRRVIITGGEALLNPKHIELILLIRKDFPKAEIALFSNGRLVNKLPRKNLKVLPNIKNFIVSVSDYKGWNDDIKKRYDNNYKMPKIWKRIITKFTITNKFVQYINFDYRFPIITNKIRRFLFDPLKRGNVYFSGWSGFWNFFDDPNLSEEIARTLRVICVYHIHIIGRKLYNCCIAEGPERYYNTDSVSVEFDKNWKRNYFKIPTWKACAHCRMGADRLRFDNIDAKLGNKKYVSMETKRKIVKLKSHE